MQKVCMKMIMTNKNTMKFSIEYDDFSVDDTQRLKKINDKIYELEGIKKERKKRKSEIEQKISSLNQFLSIADQVTQALDQLTNLLLNEVVELLQEKLTIALQEVLEQPIELLIDKTSKRGSIDLSFSINRNGYKENIMKAQGGSVVNILSVGLRLFALTRLDKEKHRRLLILDEQDCWLHPHLVPKLVKIIKLAAEELGFQIIYISHHDKYIFEEYADKIFKLSYINDEVIVTSLD